MVLGLLLGLLFLVVCPTLGYTAKRYLDKHPIKHWQD